MGSPNPAMDKIRKECQQRGALWEDPDFPADNHSLYHTGYKLPEPVEWMRPWKYSSLYGLTPVLFADFTDVRLSLQQGSLGDCWMVASLAAMATDGKEMLNRVIPVNQNFSNADGYCGAFQVNFWRFGRWVSVIVDDRLPTINNQLVYVHSDVHNEFWGSLVEKAYAKLNGSYEALLAGLMCDALDDITGGITVSVLFGKPATVPQHLVRSLMKSFARHSIVGTGIDPRASGQTTKEANGLVSGHAYTVSQIRNIKVRNSDVTLIRIRNPWGNAVEWNGAWSDGSSLWNQVDASMRKELQTVKDDGEFWMDFSDYLKNFSSLYICNLPAKLAPSRPNPAHGRNGIPRSPVEQWTETQWTGKWVKGKNDGGRPFLQKTFWKNPQYRFQLHPCIHPEDNTPDTTSCIIGLQQKDNRRSDGARQYLTIGFIVYKLAKGKRYPNPLPQSWFQQNPQYFASVFFFTAGRSNVRNFEFPPGEYLVVPCTYDAGKEGDFLLRVYMEKGSFRKEDGSINSTENDSKQPSERNGLISGASKDQKYPDDDTWSTRSGSGCCSRVTE